MVFAKDDSHAEDIVEIIREEFGKGNDFCKKITYRTMERTEDLIAEFSQLLQPTHCSYSGYDFNWHRHPTLRVLAVHA